MVRASNSRRKAAKGVAGAQPPRPDTAAAIRALAAGQLGRWSPIIVSNRAPYEPAGGARFRRGSGGLVTALLSVAEATGASWIACAQTDMERALARERGSVTAASAGRHPLTIHYVDPGERAYRLHYSVISNPLLWFIQHYLWDLARQPVITQRIHDAWSQGYVEVNRLIADKVVEVASRTKAPLLLIQDYHLYLLPEFVRNRMPWVAMQHFIHIPWPAADYWKVLPASMRNAIFGGLLANDVIGFQTNGDVWRFLNGCSELMGLRVDLQERAVLHRGRAVWVRAYPVSMDASYMSRVAAEAATRAELRRLRASAPEQVIVRVDRTDPSKNILRGFWAYERLLSAHPEHIGKVQFWAFLQPSRQDVGVYRSYVKSIDETAASINRRLGGPDWLPIRLEYGENIHRAVAGFTGFDVLLVNPIFDGMNLVAKEGAFLNRREGVVVLSENAGAYEELRDNVIGINPFDVEATAQALHRALTMPLAARAEMAHGLRETVRERDITRWIDHQLYDLKDLLPQPVGEPA
jgi:trehalose 6-phosphate synthase